MAESRVERDGKSPGARRGGTRTRTGARGTRTSSIVRPPVDEPLAGTRSVPGLEIYGLLLTGFAILLLLSLVSFDARDVALNHQLRVGGTQNLIGPVGAHGGDLLLGVFGLGAFLACCTFFFFGGMLLAGRRPGITGGGVIAYLAVMVFSCVVAHLLLGAFRPFAHTAGGLTGEWVGEILRALFATTGTVIIAAAVLLASILRLSGMTLTRIARLPQLGASWVQAWLDARNGRGDLAEAAAVGLPEASDTKPAKRLGLRRIERPRMRAGIEGERPDYMDAQPGSDEVYDRPTLRQQVGEASPDEAQRKTVQPGPPPSAESPPPVRTPAFEPADCAEGDDPAPPRRVVPGAASRGLVIAERVESSLPSLVPDQKSLPLDELLTYEPPSLSLLDYEPPMRGVVDQVALQEAANTLEAKLADFGVKGEVVRIQPGPVVTTFEFLPAAGIKISKIQNLADDLTMALHALRVRIVAPIPGKGVVGIEVPSAIRETVYLKEILAHDEFQNHRGKLPIALGKDIVGHPVVADLAKMPHVLVAGATGSGKSVAINAFILSLCYRLKPRDLRFILVDPKMLELSVYDDIPHLLLPVVTEPKKATLALKWACSEMDRRYRLLASFGVRNIGGFNQKVEKFKSGQLQAPDGVSPDELEHLPFLVIIVDELADLMMVAGKEVEKSIARLAQKARAAGLHLVVATQRPSVDVITGLIKANFPTRMSFMVSQKVDSKTILDRQGADKLLGMGDMLYLPPGSGRLVRAQGCFVSDDEVLRVAGHLKVFGPPEYDETILIDDEDGDKDLSKEDYDPLFDEAVKIVTDTRNPSISYLQRRLKIGYNRSARVIERMEYDGIISRPDHRGVRKVLAPAAQEL